MLKNLFNKTFVLILFSVILLEIGSFLAHQFLWLNVILFALICSLAAVLSLWRLEYGLYFLLAELFVGSKGYLFFLDFEGFRISVRMGLFAVVFIVWLLNLFKNRDREFFKSPWLGYYLALFVFLTLGAINGLLNSQPVAWWLDLNGWLYFLIAPAFFAAVKNQRAVWNVFSILMASVLCLSVKTIVVALSFSYGFSRIGDVFYQWLRNSGVGEITYVTGDFYRIFFQAHFYVLIGLLACLALLVFKKQSWGAKAPLIALSVLAGASLLLSSSRSLWLGLAAGLVMLFLIWIIKYQASLRQATKALSLLVLIVLAEAMLLSAAFNGFGASLLGNRLDLENEPASVSRLQQLKPLGQAISRHPFLGSGFGKEVTYVSFDPRIRQRFPDGRYTTYAFEWGFLDIWLKLGFFGLLAYFLLMVKIGKESLKAGLAGEMIFIGLAALAIIHIFSPYLNHPLGIGFIILASSLIYSHSHGEKNSQAGS